MSVNGVCGKVHCPPLFPHGHRFDSGHPIQMTKTIKCPHCSAEIGISIYAVTYYCAGCHKKLEVKKCEVVDAVREDQSMDRAL